MTHHAFTFCQTALHALPSGALWWSEAELLVVSDLHLGKSERMARRGGTLLPPYETIETLDRLSDDIASTGARAVICLGDSFDDLTAGTALDENDRQRLASLMAGRRWIWIEGNHDPGPLNIGGSHLAEIARGALTFRHIARPSAEVGEVSGHYHPKIKLTLKSRPLSRRCFLVSKTRLILPAYGTYTGGLDATDPALADLMGQGAMAILTGTYAHAVPLDSRAA